MFNVEIFNGGVLVDDLQNLDVSVEMGAPPRLDRHLFLSTSELSERWNVPPSTLGNLRRKRQGVPSFRRGGLVFYSLAAVLHYEQIAALILNHAK